MKLWLDVHIAPALVKWLEAQGLEAATFASEGWERHGDLSVFEALAQQGAVIVSKDRDFVDIVRRNGPPPQILWIRRGNCSSRSLIDLFEAEFDKAIAKLVAGASVVELE